jgi:putative polyhydroxyalkanoate system protein
MADLHIFHPHNTSKEQALRKLQDLAPALISKYGVHVSWNGYSLRFNRSGVSGTATVRERDIELNLDISWYLAIFRPQIEQGVRQQLSKYFP